MASPVIAQTGCTIFVNLFDGTRQPVPPALEALITIRDGNQREVYRDFSRGGELRVQVPFCNGLADNYTVAASAKGYEQAGFTPVAVSPAAPRHVDLMLLPKNAGFNFNEARWDILTSTHPKLAALLSAGTTDEVWARDRYGELMERRPAALACLLNLTTAMADIRLPSGCPLDYFRELLWDESMAQDRFFAYADGALVDQVRRAVEDGEFAPEPGTALYHPGATSSFKQVQFGEANVQITFHENPEDGRIIDGVGCVKVEPDIDYYKDPLAHALLEVLPNALSGGLTDPKQAYVLRWIAGRHAGVPEFNPPYVIA